MSFTNRLEHAFGGLDGFHVVLLAPEAVAPRPQPEPEPGPGAPVQPAGAAPTFGRVSREELYTAVSDAVDVSRVYAGLTVLSTVVAAVGLMRDDVAVIVGAMVIAPLLGPNVAMAFATTVGETMLLRRALTANPVSITVAFGIALGVTPRRLRV